MLLPRPFPLGRMDTDTVVFDGADKMFVTPPEIDAYHPSSIL
jgi:hypothetical protein